MGIGQPAPPANVGVGVGSIGVGASVGDGEGVTVGKAVGVTKGLSVGPAVGAGGGGPPAWRVGVGGGVGVPLPEMAGVAVGGATLGSACVAASVGRAGAPTGRLSRGTVIAMLNRAHTSRKATVATSSRIRPAETR